MERSVHTIEINVDVRLLCLEVSVFPKDIKQTFEQLLSALPFSSSRGLYGISRPEFPKGIVYRAAATCMEEEEASDGFGEVIVLPKGVYRYIDLDDIHHDPEQIGEAFEQLLQNERMDPEGFCVEKYGKDGPSVRCLVRVKED
jgi:hypothetical protein